MTLEQFAREYRAMRNLQKEYFRTRSQSVLNESKAREKILDQKADDIINGCDNNLFGSTANE